MPKPNLRVFPSTDVPSNRQQRELDRLTGVSEAKTVEVSLRQFAPLLVDAAKSHRTWLSDFADDTIRIDADLYDVLLAYQQLRHQDAA